MNNINKKKKIISNMSTLTIINKQDTFILEEFYEYPSIVNRHYAFDGGGPMSPAYYGFDELIDFVKILNTSRGYIKINNEQGTSEGTPINHRIVQRISKENGEEVSLNTSVPIQKLKVHMDWQDRLDKVRKLDLFFYYSKDNKEWFRIPLRMNLSENYSQNYH